MILRKAAKAILTIHPWCVTNVVTRRNIQISVIGAANEIGSNLSLLLKQNPKVRDLNLYDEDERIVGLGTELAHVPGGPSISVYGSENIGPAIQSSDLIVMVARTSRKPGQTREQMIAANAPAVLKLCKAIIGHNPEAFLAISTNPLNSIIPFVSGILFKYNCYNPFRLFGITHIDTARSRAFAGNALKVNPRHIDVPVIGGHSDQTIIPLFSNLTPTYYSVDACQADMLTRLVRKAGTEVLLQKHGEESATLAMAWSIHEFVDGMIDAICGSEVVLNCYTANPHFGTRFFSGPTVIGSYGIIQTCCDLPMSEYEGFLLNTATPAINRDITMGEDYIKYIEGSMKL